MTLTLRPDRELTKKKLEAEESALEEIKKNLSDIQINEILQQTKELSKRQAQDDDPELLPKVTLNDVPQEITEPEFSKDTLNNSGLVHAYFAQPTNGLVYQQVIIEMPELEAELLDILPLYTSCLPEFGIGQKSYEDVQTWQSQISGGVNCFSSIRSGLDDVQQSKAFISISSKALAKNQIELTNLLYQTLTSCLLYTSPSPRDS